LDKLFGIHSTQFNAFMMNVFISIFINFKSKIIIQITNLPMI
jgi:hypothetical protein